MLIRTTSAVMSSNILNSIHKSAARRSSSAIRSTQAAEVFRSNFAKMAGSDVTIQISSLDQCVRETRTRPSVLIDAYAIVGAGLGFMSRSAPLEIKKAMLGSVDEAVRRSLNDDIRDIDDEEDEVKEAVKFHRDISLLEGVEGETDTSTVLGRAKEATTLAFHNALRLSRRI